jgi:hypothetical protein
MDDPQLPLRHPANSGLIAYFTARPPRRIPVERHVESGPPEAVERPYDQLGSHPDEVSQIWDTLDAELPQRCRWIVDDTPVLAHPRTGVIFAFTGGTTYALRLAPADIDAALAAEVEQVHHFPAYPELDVTASTLDLRKIAPDWVFGAWRREEPRWIRAAFDEAGAGWPGRA